MSSLGSRLFFISFHFSYVYCPLRFADSTCVSPILFFVTVFFRLHNPSPSMTITYCVLHFAFLLFDSTYGISFICVLFCHSVCWRLNDLRAAHTFRPSCVLFKRHRQRDTWISVNLYEIRSTNCNSFSTASTQSTHPHNDAAPARIESTQMITLKHTHTHTLYIVRNVAWRNVRGKKRKGNLLERFFLNFFICW